MSGPHDVADAALLARVGEAGDPGGEQRVRVGDAFFLAPRRELRR